MAPTSTTATAASTKRSASDPWERAAGFVRPSWTWTELSRPSFLARGHRYQNSGESGEWCRRPSVSQQCAALTRRVESTSADEDEDE
ncbi:hypothetical protein ACRE_075700 [Hapsidospora chrysogenum ATCC 11550]|uniref:Uncharacterized protein n=1 Tax=Hapsidospora chrysogenum (strain ATCC 11550 / CBS 779.69 / DSM 880 / IAM 14645 / JCM 23072 / IMI 49137) TaxID=857340 RepID=A0A086SX97_HAPC1|nr:hypothetical protein ACRE_075700 [Hapsidospora chrysogenum ATCC 11550]